MACVRVSDIEQEIRLKHEDTLQELEGAYQTLMKVEDVRAFSSLRTAYLESLKPVLEDFELLKSLTDGGSLCGAITRYAKQQQVEQRAGVPTGKIQWHRFNLPVSIPIHWCNLIAIGTGECSSR